MSAHHPEEDLLVAFAGGRLDDGERLLLATHCSLCADCAGKVRDLECVAGAMLEDTTPAALSAGALDEALARVSVEGRLSAAEKAQAHATDLPTPIASRQLDPWRRLAPGVRMRRIKLDPSSPTRAFLLEAAPETTMLPHDHTELEWTCVLAGAFREGQGLYRKGDFQAAGAEDHHRVRTEPGERCVCLIGVRGALKWRGLFGPLANLAIRL